LTNKAVTQINTNQSIRSTAICIKRRCLYPDLE
jgi:hypothetical protein